MSISVNEFLRYDILRRSIYMMFIKWRNYARHFNILDIYFNGNFNQNVRKWAYLNSHGFVMLN